MSMRNASWQAKLCLLFVPLYFFLQPVFAQTYSSPEDEFKKRVHVTDNVQALGEDALGDRVSLYDGTLGFEQTDIDEAGRGPGIRVSRTFTVPDESPGYAFHAFHSNAFVDWDLEIPHIETLSAPTKVVTNGLVSYQWYLVDDYYGTVRCSGMGQAPSMYVGSGANIATYSASDWWHGYHLMIPGESAKQLLRLAPGNTQVPSMTDASGNPIAFKSATTDHWAVGCLPQMSGGVPGEGYLAVSPEGTKYYLDVLVRRSADAVMGSPGVALKRQMLSFMPSKVVDRFGNTVVYSYDANGNLSRMESDDGRRVDLFWESWKVATNDPGPASPTTQYTSFRITQVTEQPQSTTPRSWQYLYSTDPTTPRLQQVILPDQTSWAFDLSGLPATNPEALIAYTGAQGTCTYTSYPGQSKGGTGSITAPSGLKGTFVASTAIRGRSKVPVACSNPHAQATIPRVYAVTSLASKTLSGPGLAPKFWSYSYSPSNESWAESCNGCATTVWTNVVDPDGNASSYTFSNVFDATESQLQQTDTYAGAAVGTPIRTERITYATSGPWPSPIGSTSEITVNEAQLTGLFPRASDIVTLSGGDMFSLANTAYNTFAQATTITRSSSTNPASRTENISYLNDVGLWVIGHALKQMNASNGEVISETTYAANDMPSGHLEFGRQIMSFGYDSLGQLATMTDPSGRMTRLVGQQRGIPTTVTFNDGRTDTYGVDDFGDLSWHTDRSGHTTAYGRDAMGRVSSETVSGPDTTWTARAIRYDLVGTAERGLDAGHFRRTETQGDRAEVTFFDGRLQPVLVEAYRISDGGLRTTLRTDYDWRGNEAKKYYPLAGGPLSLASFSEGIATTYDALGRVSAVTEDTELGTATTSTSYPAGAKKQVTDPYGNTATTAYWMLDQPDYSLPVSLTAPVGAMTVVQTVYRDVYGKPYRVEQGGDATVAKTFAYDAYYNLCRVTEPETGSTIIATDANGNVAWSANGLGYAASGDEHDCGTTTVTDSQKAVRSYGQVGELTGVAYGDGSPSASFIHTGTGLLAQAKVSGAQWDYGYNSLDKLTSETLTIDGHAWSFTYAYDGNGALLSTTYPDGNVISSQPDALGRPTGAGAFASGGQYLPSGGLAQFSFGSGAVYNATENTRGLPINLSYGTASAVAVAEDVGYDKRSDVTSVNDLVGSGSRSKTFGYDALRRLQSASSPMWGSDIYTYNALGDLTSITNGSSQTGFSYQNGQLVTVTKDGVATPYHYDNRGNVVQRGTQGFTYDLAERMSSAVGLESYQYDGNGNRVKSVSSSGGTTYTVYGQSGRLLMTFDGTTGKATDYIYLGGKLVATQSNLLAPSAAPVLSAPATGQVGTTFPVAWTAVTAATTYSLQESVSGSGYVTIYSGASLSQSLTKASAGSYAYRVQACNSVGCGPWSAIGTTTVAAPPAAPDAPAAIAAVLSGDLSIISVSWSASSGATSYVVQEKVGNGAWAAFYSGSGTSAAVSSPADGAYAFQVQACSANGCSAWTLSTATTVAHIPPTPGAISVPGTNAGSFTVSWSASAYATYYALDVSVNGQAFDAVGNVAATSYSTTVGASGTYAYRVRACNGNGCSGYTGVTTTSTLLKPTAAPGISNSGNNSTGSFSVAWSAVTDGATYTLQEQVNGGAFSVVQSSGSLSWSTGGRGSATYGYQVQACNTSGCGPWSGTSGLTVAIIPATPSYVTLTESGPTGKFRINASWSAVSAATSYQLEQTSPEEGTVIVQNSAATTYSVLLFENGTIRYRVKACNANGCSAFGPYSSTQILNGN